MPGDFWHGRLANEHSLQHTGKHSFSLDSPAPGCPGNFPLEGSPAPAVHKVLPTCSLSQAREELLASAKIKPYIFRLGRF